MRYFENANPDGSVIQIHIADIHFGAVDPMKQYTILKEQFLNQICRIKFDILSIDGDLFDKRFLANSDAVMCAISFIEDCIALCQKNQATLVLLAGTMSHDAGQLRLFYNLENRVDIDVRIIESIRFEYIKGLKILCIPEEYGKSAEYYAKYLIEDYDACFAHCTVVGSVYGANTYILESNKAPVFDTQAFNGCRGPVICGHVHKAGCFGGNVYYCSNPIRYRFGEEEDKGYLVVLQSPVGHYVKFMSIESFRYDTIKISSINKAIVNGDIVAYLDGLKSSGINHIRLDFDENIDTLQNIVETHYASDPDIVIKRYDKVSEKEKAEALKEADSKYAGMDFLLDNSMDGYTKFVNFVNYNEGKTMITVEQLRDVLSGKNIIGMF